MRFRSVLLALFYVSSLALPLIAYAGVPFFGPIIPPELQSCPIGWAGVIDVANRIISFLITIGIVFFAPLMIAWAGFLFVLNPYDPGYISKAKGILWNTVLGIVIALVGYMIVAALMAALYNQDARVPGTSTVLGTWQSLIGSGGESPCIKLRGSTPSPGVTPTTPTVVSGGPGKFTYQSGISAQRPTASAALNNLLSCMEKEVPAGVGQISSISDNLIVSGQKTFAQCATGGCSHTVNSCHYGGKTCVGSSYAVDFGDEQNAAALTAAAQKCGAQYIGYEGNHLHVSVGKACGCN